MSESPHDKPSAPVAAPRLVRFGIVHILYAVAALGSSLALLGICGVVQATLTLVVWAVIFKTSPRPSTLVTVCLLVLLVPWSTCLLLPTFHSAVSAARQTSCHRNLMVLVVALQTYHDTHGTFPPAYVPDENGKPKHSWRVLILPFLEGEDLYEAYNFDEPWDGPNNRKLLENMPTNFACPARVQPNDHTSYLAVIGPRTAWPGEKATRYADFTDGLSNTILIIEADSQGVPWTQPRDMSLNEALEFVTSDDLDRLGGHGHDEFFYEQHSGRLVGFADMGTEFLPHGMPEERWVALLTINDGERVNLDRIDYPVRTLKRPNVGNWYRLSLFVLLMLLPLPWALMSLVRRVKK